MPLEDWLSAHVYLGIALAVISTLHAGFQFGANIHTVLYVLMMLTILSGIVGVYFYIRYPKLLTENRRGLSTKLMLGQLADLDRDIRQAAINLDDITNEFALRSVQDTALGTSLISQLLGTDPNCPTSVARRNIENSETTSDDAQRRHLLTRL